ncbi:MAG: hypothetical protein ACRCS8_00065 [Brevinema sp.]
MKQKAAILVILKSLGLSIIISLLNAFSPFVIENNTLLVNKTTFLSKFLKESAILIMSFLYPIIVSSFISIKLYILQKQSEILNNKLSDNEKLSYRKMYDTYDCIGNALLRIVKILFWMFILFLFLYFLQFKNLLILYIQHTIMMTVFITFFFGLYQMVIDTFEIMKSH